VKTLHPKLHAGILAPRTREGLKELEAIGSAPVDLVAVDLYPFEEAVRTLPGDRARGVEHIDIGGVTLLRAAAKNADCVVVLPDAASREEFLGLLGASAEPPRIRVEDSRRWAARAFRTTSAYDAAIAAWTDDEALPEVFAAGGRRTLRLRYGENPHQAAAWYRVESELPFERLHEGREISWNNLLDIEAAAALAGQLDAPAAVIVKHTNPCGACAAATVEQAVEGAWAGDPLSAFGGIVAVRGRLSEAAARVLAAQFVEVVAAEDFEPAALACLRAKKGLRILKGRMGAPGPARRVRSLLGGLGVQTGEAGLHGEWRGAARRDATAAERQDLEMAWRVVAAAQSNGIAVVRDGRLIGLGSGQTSRVDAVHMALYKAGRCGHDVRGAALASDGFFPFRDGVDLAAQGGVAAVVQPGGSRRDAEVIAAADEHGMAMLLTGARCFRH
jgi:phosphoribosylaminoimidazolecarboxamide formyltransferase/IMP cyclohydrolase